MLFLFHNTHKKNMFYFLTLALLFLFTGCVHNSNSTKTNSSKDNLVLKSDLPHQALVQDPQFLLRQKQAEESFFAIDHEEDEDPSLIAHEDTSPFDIEEEYDFSSPSSLPRAPSALSAPSSHAPKSKINSKFGGMPLLWPTQGTLSSLFGLRKLRRISRKHMGIDISAPVGTPVRAAAAGQILFVGSKSGYGLSIITAHDSRHQTLYAHLSRMIVRPGQFVRQHEIIGYVGRTGRNTGAHLHFETRVNGVAKNPLSFLPTGLRNSLSKGMKTPSLAEQGEGSQAPVHGFAHFTP